MGLAFTNLTATEQKPKETTVLHETKQLYLSACGNRKLRLIVRRFFLFTSALIRGVDQVSTVQQEEEVPAVAAVG